MTDKEFMIKQRDLNSKIIDRTTEYALELKAKLKEADEGLINSINRIDGLAKRISLDMGNDYDGSESKYARTILESIRGNDNERQ